MDIHGQTGRMLLSTTNMKYDNLSWAEGDLWYGWTYNPKTKRYYFNDVGHESLIELWEEQWRREAENDL